MCKQKIAEFTESSEESQAHTYVVTPICMAAGFSLLHLPSMMNL